MSLSLTALRTLMQQHQLDFYLVLGTDPHQSEYVPPYWQRRSFISGFTGSNGDVLIGKDQAYLWTDGRYTLQAQLELDPKAFTLFEYGKAANILEFLQQHAAHKRVGVDLSTLSYRYKEKLQAALNSVKAKFIQRTDNLIDAIWSDRPAMQHAPVMVYPLKYAGVSTQEKLGTLRSFMQAQQLHYLALNELNSIAWLFNIRGHDTEDTPLVFSYALISEHAAKLYIHPQSWTQALKDYCQQNQISLRAYDDFYSDLARVKKSLFKKVSIGFDEYANALMYETAKAHKKILTLPIALTKACKNKAELQGMINAHIEDGVALVRFFAWLEHHWQHQTEVTIADKLEALRKESPLFYSLSFPTIAGFKDHSAIIHYHAEAKTAHTILDDGMLLIDSGAQYLGGTTDVTRTLHFGTPTAFEKACYTRVLKGHLALGHTAFPQGTRGNQLDSLARQYLWQQGYNYAHGTGHGVGAFLNVHEGPQSISTGAANTTPLLPNMILSNEPGVYFAGQFGIRIENLCYVKKAQEMIADNAFYLFEDLTLVPYCRNLIEVALLTSDEIALVNQYHERVFNTLEARVDSDVRAWLKAATAPL